MKPLWIVEYRHGQQWYACRDWYVTRQQARDWIRGQWGTGETDTVRIVKYSRIEVSLKKQKPKRNKVHTPRPRAELLAVVAKRLSKLDTNFDLPNPKHIDDMSAQLQRGLNRLKFGQAEELDLLNLQDAANVALKLITDKNFPEALIHAKSAEHALIMIDERKTTTGRWVAKASELEAIEAFLPLHDAIVQNSPHIEIERATAAVQRDLEAA